MERKLFALLLALAVALAPLCALGQDDPDEQSLALTDEAETAAPSEAAPEDSARVYAVSDAPGGEETRIAEGERPEYVRWLLEVAAGELGYTEGPNNLTKYGEWSGDPNAAWCAEFVCWCVDQVDQRHNTALLNQTYPNYSGQNTGRDWFVKRGRFVYRKGNCPGWGYQWLNGADDILRKNGYIPRAGDWVFFSYNEAGDTEHVALVEYCARDAAGDVVVHVIEGNNPSQVQRNLYKLDNSQILGFGACEEVVGTTMRVGNRGDKVLKLQQDLNALGLLADRHLTGGYGGNTKRAVMTFQSDCMQDKNANGVADRETQQAIERAVAELVYNSPDSWLVGE